MNNIKYKETVGEITGEFINPDTLEKGMPLQSYIQTKRNMYDGKTRNDFELLNKTEPNNKVQAYDENNIDVFDKEETLTSQINPLTICQNNISNLTIKIHEMLNNLMIDKKYIINGFGIYDLMTSLYIVSTKTTEIEIKEKFNLSTKQNTIDGLNKYREMYDLFKMKNFYIVGNDVPVNMKAFSAIKNNSEIIIVNEENGFERINNFINKKMNCVMKNPVNSDNLFNIQLMLMMCSVVTPKWTIQFDKTINNNLCSFGKTYKYYENEKTQMIEFDCYDNKIKMGFVNGEFNIKNITKLKNELIDIVKIPVIEIDYKMRMTNIIKQLGIETLFMQMNSFLFNKGCVLHDVVQNIKLVINNNGNKSGNKNIEDIFISGGGKKISFTEHFTYYLKTAKTNHILLIGVY